MMTAKDGEDPTEWLMVAPPSSHEVVGFKARDNELNCVVSRMGARPRQESDPIADSWCTHVLLTYLKYRVYQLSRKASTIPVADFEHKIVATCNLMGVSTMCRTGEPCRQIWCAPRTLLTISSTGGMDYQKWYGWTK